MRASSYPLLLLLASILSVGIIGKRAKPKISVVPEPHATAFLITDPVPAFPDDVNAAVVGSYAGYMPVPSPTSPEQVDSLFFWYFPGPSASRTLTVYLNGGPGCSSLVGLFQSNGPVRYDASGKFYAHNASWHLQTHVVYVDQPVGTGYSFGGSSADGGGQGEQAVAKVMRGFLGRFLTVFDKVLKAGGPGQVQVVLAGESFAGQYLPFLAMEVLTANSLAWLTGDVVIHLKSLLILSPWFYAARQYESYLAYILSNNLLRKDPDALSDLNLLYSACEIQIRRSPATYIPVCASMVDYVRAYVQDNDPGSCLNEYDMRLTAQGVCAGDLTYGDFMLLSLLNSPSFRSIIHADAPGSPSTFLPCSSAVLQQMSPDASGQSYSQLQVVLSLGVPVTVVSGESDMITNSLGVGWGLGNMTWLLGTGFGVDVDLGAAAFKVGGDVVGSVISARNLAWYRLKNAGHYVGMDAPVSAGSVLGSVLANSSCRAPLIC